jgi:preprotein translocase subunit SecF
MHFKGVDFWPHGTKLRIMELRYYFIGVSCLAVLASIVVLSVVGLNFGIDFKGGSLFEVRAKNGPISTANLRERVAGLGLGDVQIQALDTPEEALIRVEQQPGGESAQQEAASKVRDALGSEIEIRRTEVVGGVVSGELKRASSIAILCAIIGILIYVWFRFEWQFGLAAILALLHDIFVTIGLLALLRFDFGLTEVAALLTLAGYSINDTVVVFDRIRENLRRYKKMPLLELMNQSINETLSRTVLTATTLFLAVGPLFFFGTEVIRGFSFTMLFGVLIGTWSSIFIASTFLIWIGVKRDWSDAALKGNTVPGRP